MAYHALLKRQLEKHIGAASDSWAPWAPLVQAVNEAYMAFEENLRILERSMELVSAELMEKNDQLAADLEQRKITEQQLEYSLSVHRATLESTADGILVVDAAGKMLSANQKFLTMWKIPEALRLHWDDGMIHRFIVDQLHTPQNLIFKTGLLKKDDYDVLELKDQRLFERYWQSQKINGVDVGGVWSFRDVTERRDLQARMLQSEKMSAVGQLAAGVAHEINNPLGVILGFAQLVSKRLHSDDPLEHPLKSIEREALRCKRLVQDLLTFSHVSNGREEEVEVNKEIERVLTLISPDAKLRGIDVHSSLTVSLPKLRINPTHLEQILINLTGNAIDAMSHGGHLSIATQITGEVSGAEVLLRVQDSGEGIPEDILPHIFEPFFTTKSVGKGSGLGLSLVYEMVKRYRGTVEVESQPGNTEFTVRFPVLPAP